MRWRRLLPETDLCFLQSTAVSPSARIGRYFPRLLVVLLLALDALALGYAGPAAAAMLEAKSLQQIRASNEYMSATDFLDICKSTDAEKSEYCNGYLRGVVFFWQRRMACALKTPSARSFCDGEKYAAEKRLEILGAYEASQNLGSRLGPGNRAAEPERRAELFRKLLDHMREKMGQCVPGEHRDKYYCQAYNLEAESAVAELMAMHPGGGAANPGALGLGDATGSKPVFLMASKEAHRFFPCLSPAVTVRQARDALLEFVGKHPEQQKGLRAFELIGRALYYALCPASPEVQPNVEQCLEWTYRDGMFGAENTCDKEITIRFMTDRDKHIVEGLVKPGGFFRSGLSATQEKAVGWFFTACPAGSFASVGFNPDDKETRAMSREKIRESTYDCVVK